MEKNEIDKATQEWLNSYKKSSRATYKSFWRYFVEFTGLTGDEILASRERDEEHAWEKKVLEFKNWMVNVKKQSEYSATTAATTARSFFSFHRLGLKLRRGESARLKEAKPKYEDYRFSREDLKKMSDVSDLQEKYVLTAGKSFGLRAGDFLRLTRGDMEAYLDRPTPISVGEYATQKEKVKAFPFIDIDALPVINLMIEKMDREGKTKPTDRILTFTKPIQLSRVLRRITERAGINIGNKRVRFHCLRKFLTDRLSSYMSESKWKQIVGKKISEGAYVSPDSLRKDYIRAMDETCFPKITLGRQQAVERIMNKIIHGEPLTDEDRGDIAKYGIALREKGKRTQPNGGNDCSEYKEIDEADLLNHLQNGWRIVHTNSNGKVIVSRGA